jgi:hypothetical protein
MIHSRLARCLRQGNTTVTMTLIEERVWHFALERGVWGFTDIELDQVMAQRLQDNLIMSTSTYRTRRCELTRLGLIIDTGRRTTHLYSPTRLIIDPGHRKTHRDFATGLIVGTERRTTHRVWQAALEGYVTGVDLVQQYRRHEMAMRAANVFVRQYR